MTYRNVEDAINAIRRIRGYRLLHPAAHSVWLDDGNVIENIGGRQHNHNGTCFAVLHRHIRTSSVPQGLCFREHDEITTVIVTVSPVERRMIDPMIYFGLSRFRIGGGQLGSV
jgi:hypothetical protein